MQRAYLFPGGRVCGVVAASTASEVWAQFEAGKALTCTLELRLDWLANDRERRMFLGTLGRRASRRKLCLIATCRRIEGGGKFAGTANEQLSWLREAARAGCKWVDIEAETAEGIPPFVIAAFTSPARRIFSIHDFSGRQSVQKLAAKAANANSGMFAAIKIAAHCDSLAKGLELLALARKRSATIAVPMGEIAQPLRILALREGSALAYAPVDIHGATAPGQVPLREMQQLYRAGTLDRKMRVYGVIGDPIAHSLSPVLHNEGFQARKKDAVYLPFRVRDLRDFIRAIDPLGIHGFSVTLPHKRAILRHLDGCDPLAAEIGAVNTVGVHERGKLFGYNTDYVGILRALEKRIIVRGSRILIYGAGGVARALAFALSHGGAVVSICARRIERAKSLARAVKGEAVPRKMLAKEYFDAIVNATPVGMHPYAKESPLTSRELNCRVAFDTIYRPRETELLRIARRKGIETISGVEMFLAQGVAQWEIWMGERAPEAAMRRAVLHALDREELEEKHRRRR